MKDDSFTTVVMVCDFQTDFRSGVLAVHRRLDQSYDDFEIVLVRQGPVLTHSLPQDEILASHSCIRLIQLTSSVDLEVAWGAGLLNAIGDYVVLLDPRCDPPELIPTLVDRCRQGFDVVVGTARRPSSWSYAAFRWAAAGLLKAIGYDLPRYATGLRCLSRRAVNAVTRSGQFHRQLYLRIQSTGYPWDSVDYSLQGAVEKRDFLGGLRSVMRLLVFNSSRPLRWMSGLGILGSTAASLFGLYSVLIHLLTGNVVQGWTTTILFMSLLSLIQFIMLAFFGEYLGRLLDERRDHDGYSVVYEKTSRIMVNQDRVNVHESPLPPQETRVQTGRRS